MVIKVFKIIFESTMILIGKLIKFLMILIGGLILLIVGIVLFFVFRGNITFGGFSEEERREQMYLNSDTDWNLPSYIDRGK